MIKEIHQKDPRTGIIYVYEAEVVWDKAKKQSRYASRRMIGHIDPDTGEVVANRVRKTPTEVHTSTRLFAGATHLLTQLFDQIGVSNDLAKVLGDDLSDALASFAMFLVSQNPAPASRFLPWARTHVHPLGEPLSSQRWSEVFASISQHDIEAFFRARVKRASGDYWFFDTTSISSYSQLLERVRWGRNKDGVGLAQINLALVKDATTKLPLAFKDLPGMISDVTMVNQLLADFSHLGAGRMKLCMDRGFYSKTNINHLMGAHMKFLIGVRVGLSYVKRALGEHCHHLRSWECYDSGRDLYGKRIDYRWSYDATHPRREDVHSVKRSYLHLYFNPGRANDDEKAFARLLDQLHKELTSGDTLVEHTGLYKKYFQHVRGKWTGRDDANEAERARHGYFALLSNDASLDCWQALDIYQGKDEIEKAFHDIKDRLDLRTTKVHNQHTLTGKLFTVFIGLILATELRRRMKASGLDQDYTMTELIDELETIEQHHHLGHRPHILHVTKKQADIYKQLSVEPPATS